MSRRGKGRALRSDESPIVDSAGVRSGLSNALVLANRLPFPLDDGWKVRTFHMVRAVAAVADHTTLVVFHPAEDVQTIGEARAAFEPSVDLRLVPPPPAYTPAHLVRGILSGTPVHVWNQESLAMRRELRGLIAARDFDLLLAETTFMTRYLDAFPPGVPRVIDTHNIDSVTLGRYARRLGATPRGWYAGMTARKLKRFEARTFAKTQMIWVCSDEEAGLVRQMVPAANVWVVPNGVDTTRMAPLPQVAPVPGRVVFFGRLDYFPNADAIEYFAARILPRLDDVPDLELWIVGSGATREMRALVERTPRLRMIGRVEELPPVLATASAIAVPLRLGGGTRLKILEALSMALPVVSTTIGAEGLSLRPGKDLLIADEPDAFADGIRALLTDRASAKRLGVAGRETVQQLYDWSCAREIVARSMVGLERARR